MTVRLEHQVSESEAGVDLFWFRSLFSFSTSGEGEEEAHQGKRRRVLAKMRVCIVRRNQSKAEKRRAEDATERDSKRAGEQSEEEVENIEGREKICGRGGMELVRLMM